jgi:hypothetical protein
MQKDRRRKDGHKWDGNRLMPYPWSDKNFAKGMIAKGLSSLGRGGTLLGITVHPKITRRAEIGLEASPYPSLVPFLRVVTASGAPTESMQIKHQLLQCANMFMQEQCILVTVKRYGFPLYRPWRPLGLWEVEAPTFSRQSAHRWR